MPKDVIITPASGKLDFYGTTGGSVLANINLTDNNDLSLSTTSGNLIIGDASRDVYIGDGTNEVDIVFEQNGEIRSVAGKYVTINAGTINATGVAVNTSSPTAVMHVYGSTPSGTVLNVEGTNGSLFSVIDNLDGALMSVNNNAGLPVLEVFSDDRIVGGRFGFNDLVLTSGGNLGIGTSTPSGKLDIIGDVYVRNAANSSGVIYFKSSGIADTALKIRTDNFGNLYCDAGALGPIIKLGNQDGQAVMLSSSAWITIGQNYDANNGNQYVRFTPSNTEIMRIFSMGVGIGTTSPRGRLDVTGGLKVGGYSDNVPGSGSELIISNANSVVGVPNTNTAGIVLQHNDWNTVYIRSNPTNFRIGNNAGDALVVTHSNRNVGIGTSSPAYKLDVNGTTRITGEITATIDGGGVT